MIICCCRHLFAQQYITNQKVLSVENKLLESRNIYCLYQDKLNGYLWMGTDKGLHRFDGFSTKVFKQDIGLVSDVIGMIAEDDQHHLWVSHFQVYDASKKLQLSIFNPKTKTAIPLDQYCHIPFTVSDIVKITPLNHQEIGIITKNTIYKYSQGEITELFSPVGVQLNYYTDIIIKKNSIILSTKELLYEFDTNYQLIDSYQLYKSKPAFSLNNTGIKNIRVPLMNKKEINVNVEVIPMHKDVRIIAIDEDSGVMCFLKTSDSKKLLFSDLKGNIYHEEMLDSPAHIGYFDQKKTVWLVLWNGKIVGVELQENKFSLVGLKNTRGILKRGKELVVGSENFLHFITEKEEGQYEVSSRVKIGTEVLSLYLDQDQAIWIGDFSSNLTYYNSQKKVKHTYSYHEEVLALNPIAKSHSFWALYQDTTGTMWMGHNQGLSYFKETDGYIRHFNKYNQFTELKTATVYHFYKNSKGLWLATSKGLYLLDIQQGIIDRIHVNAEEGKQLIYNHILHIYEDKDGVFWMASKGGGLLYWNPITQKSGQFSIKDGLPDNVIYEVFEDHKGCFWLGSNRGLIRFNRKTGAQQVFTEKDGVANNEFNTSSFFLDANTNTFCYGGLYGLTLFNPRDLNHDISDNKKQRLIIDAITIQHTGGTIQEISTNLDNTTHVVTWPPDFLNLKLNFNLIHLMDGNQIQYAYKIKGFDTNWQDISTPQVTLKQLPYGTYHLLIHGKSPKANWTTPIQIAINVIPPIYLKNWFIYTTLLVIISIVFLIIRQRIRYLKFKQDRLEEIIKERTVEIAADKELIEKQAQELKKVDQIKTNFYTNISHELLTPLSLIMGPIQSLKLALNPRFNQQEMSLIELLERNTTKLKGLVDAILGLSKLEAKVLKVNKKQVNIELFVRNLYQIFESQAAFLGIVYQLEIAEISHKCILADEDKVWKIISNLLTNALKFTPSGEHITLSLTMSDQKVIIKVTDTGKGISEEDLTHVFDRFYQGQDSIAYEIGTGIGLAFSLELAKLLKGNLFVTSSLDQGSSFTFSFPLEIPVKVELEEPAAKELEKSHYMDLSNLTPEFGTKQGTILIVEDNEDMHYYIKNIVGKQFEVLSAYNGVEALNIMMAKEHTIDLVLTDLMMPKMDGLGLVEALKSNDSWCSLPIIMLTAIGSDSTKLEALTFGIDDYLTKPFHPKELLVRIKNAFRRREKVKEAHQELKSTFDKESNTNYEQEKINTSTKVRSTDQLWLKDVEQVLRKEVGNFNFKMEDLALAMNLSRKQLQRKVKKMTGLTLLEYKHEITLQIARKMLEMQECDSVKAVSLSVGFKNVHHFSKLYAERFYKLPSDYFQ